jgi:ATP-dependent protease ClpP protease subunit
MTNPTQLGTSVSTVYTVGSGITATVKQILAANVTASNATVSIHLVPSGGSATNANLIFAALTVAGNSTAVIDLNQVMSTGDTLQALAGTGSAINLVISGYEAS